MCGEGALVGYDQWWSAASAAYAADTMAGTSTTFVHMRRRTDTTAGRGMVTHVTMSQRWAHLEIRREGGGDGAALPRCSMLRQQCFSGQTRPGRTAGSAERRPASDTSVAQDGTSRRRPSRPHAMRDHPDRQLVQRRVGDRTPQMPAGIPLAPAILENVGLRDREDAHVAHVYLSGPQLVRRRMFLKSSSRQRE